MCDQNSKETKAGVAASYSHGIALVYVFAVLVSIFVPLISFLVGLIKGRRDRRYRVLMYLSIAFMLIHTVLFVFVLKPNLEEAKYKRQLSQIKKNTHDIHTALHDYYRMNCSFPDDPHILMEDAYLSSGDLINPVTDSPLELTPYDPDDFYYSIGYIPVHSRADHITYYLLAFGDENTPGYDVNGDGKGDHVIFIMSPGCDCLIFECKDGDHPTTYPTPNIEIKEVISDLKWVWR